jgi:hypothetical protein
MRLAAGRAEAVNSRSELPLPRHQKLPIPAEVGELARDYLE